MEGNMRGTSFLGLIVASLVVTGLAAIAPPAAAADPVKIGMITTLSGPGGYLGEDVRDAFLLAMDQESGGKLGGVPVQLLVQDDGLKPGNAKQIAETYLQSDKAKILTGIIFSNVLDATLPDILDAGAFYISPNAAPSNFAGKDCNKNYFVVSWQNDSLHESAGQNATNLGFKRAFILAPNYQAGKDALAGFKRFFKGEIVGELYTKLDQTDFAAELAQIRAAKPDVVFQFEPGGLGIAFLKQYVQAGLKDTIPMVVAAPSMDHRTLEAVGEAAAGINVSSHWNADFDNPANKKFVADFEAKYKRVPTYYASQGYDTARLIGSALKAVNGDMSRTDDFRAALRKADFQSVRGAFRFGPNQHPIQDWYATRVEKGPDGKLDIRTLGKVFENHGDAYSQDCKL
jgi:branched-chain amino acid transport system substrate-binding protein